MFNLVGISFLAGLGVILLISLGNVYIGKFIFSAYAAIMKAKDKRTKLANEIFSAIKFIKINAYEDYFLNNLEILRKDELSCIRKRFIISIITSFSVWMAPSLVTNATFGMFLGLGNTLDAAKAFGLISLFMIL